MAQALAAEGATVSMSSRSGSAIQGAVAKLGDRRSVWPWTSSRPLISTVGRKPRSSGSAALTVVLERRGPPGALSFEDSAWQDAANLLLFSTLRMVRAVVPSMTARGGSADPGIHLSSSVKEPINLGLTVLRASVSALAKTLALEPRGGEDSRQPDHSWPADTDRVREPTINA